jgi:hypothetical protein
MSVICARISGVLRSSSISEAGEINHEGHEGHKEFAVGTALCRRASTRSFTAPRQSEAATATLP